MGALTNHYVDPSLASDSGAGTLGDPYGDLQYALNNVSRDTSNGDQINIKSGSAEVLAAQLSLVSYGTPTAAAPLLFRGYSTAANDGGIGEISGNNGNFSLINSKYSSFVDLDMHSSGTADLLGDGTLILNCKLHDSSSGIVKSTNASVIQCHIYDVGGSTVVGCKKVVNNYFDNTDTKSSTQIIDSYIANAVIAGNIFVIGSANAVAIDVYDDFAYVSRNSILANGSSGTGIILNISREGIIFADNLIEGFSGAGGKGIDGEGHSEGFHILAGNAVYNCATPYANLADSLYSVDNETLGATPFDKSGALSYANRIAYFTPVDTGNVLGGAFLQQ